MAKPMPERPINGRIKGQSLPPAKPDKTKGTWGGARRGAGNHHVLGRVDGVRSLKNEVLTLRAKHGVMPLDYMLKVLNESVPTQGQGEKDDAYAKRVNRFEARKMWAAAQAAPYLHHRLAIIEVSHLDEQALNQQIDLRKLSDKELDQLENLVKKAGVNVTMTLDENQYHEVEIE